MATIFYNAFTHANAPARILTGIQEVSEDDVFFAWAVRRGDVYETREAAMTDKCAGSVYWRENGKAYSGYLRQPWEFKPVENADNEWGINWGDCYAVSVDALVAYIKKSFPEADEAAIRKYAQATEYGLYTVQVHYDGRVR